VTNPTAARTVEDQPQQGQLPEIMTLQEHEVEELETPAKPRMDQVSYLAAVAS
jgi:hypothetical protein